MEIEHEIISMIILHLSLIQEEHLSVTGKVCAQSAGLPLRRLSLPRKSVNRLTDWLDMTIIVLMGL